MSNKLSEYEYKKDCPDCNGNGSYYVTNSEYEEPITCSCDCYNYVEWKIELKNRK